MENILQGMAIKKDTVKEMDWFDKIKINDEITVTMLPSQHWSKRWIWGDGNTNRSLWGSFFNRI